MFKLFLKKKIWDESSDEETDDSADSDNAAKPLSRRRNRRVLERYNVDHKHLTLMNDQDILLVREISAKGFSTELSERGFERLRQGDVYEARIRYLKEIYELTARVTWKHKPFVGFEIKNANVETRSFLNRLLRPIRIAASLKEVEASFVNGSEAGKTWYHGDEDTDLYTWHDTQTKNLRAWSFTHGEDYIEWNALRGLKTGRFESGSEIVLAAATTERSAQEDPAVNDERRLFAVDVMMALPHALRDEILKTLE